MVDLVAFLGIFHFPLSLPDPSKCVILLRDGVVVVGLQSTVFFEKNLVDLL